VSRPRPDSHGGEAGCRRAPSVGRCALVGSVTSEVACVLDQFFDRFGSVSASGDLRRFSIDAIDVFVRGRVERWMIGQLALLALDDLAT
jgi:hypothetical protein